MKLLFVDRIIGDQIICENSDGREIVLNTENVKSTVKEGDVIRIEDDNTMMVDYKATWARKEEILKLREKLKKTGY